MGAIPKTKCLPKINKSREGTVNPKQNQEVYICPYPTPVQRSELFRNTSFRKFYLRVIYDTGMFIYPVYIAHVSG